MLRGVVPIVWLAACSFKPPESSGAIDAPSDTTTPDVPRDMVDTLCFGSGLDVMNVCLQAKPTASLDVGGMTDIDTMMQVDCDPGIAAFCVVAKTSIHIQPSGRLGAHGMRPLVLIATGEITIDGLLDVASHITGTQHVGPGANAMGCHNGTGPMGKGGGWGGSFGTMGGDGGPPTGGAAGAPLVPVKLQGGCSGSDAGGGGGHRGNGGGAVYLIAQTMIRISGSVNASGGAGSSTMTDNTGGGGGGAGGMIVFDTPLLMLDPGAQVYANGGGGGEGTGGNDGTGGSDPIGAAAGGLGGGDTTSGGNGGDGAAGVAVGAPGLGSTNGPNEGGGGGGGGVGVIKIFRATPPAGMISPPFS